MLVIAKAPTPSQLSAPTGVRPRDRRERNATKGDTQAAQVVRAPTGLSAAATPARMRAAAANWSAQSAGRVGAHERP